MDQELLNSIFYPNKETEKRFQTQLAFFNDILNGAKQHDAIEMGKLPPIYSALGIKDKELKPILRQF